MRKALFVKFVLINLLLYSCNHNNNIVKNGYYVNCNGEAIYYNYNTIWNFSPISNKIILPKNNDLIIDDSRNICSNKINQYKLQFSKNTIQFKYLDTCTNLCEDNLNLSIFEYLDLSTTIEWDSIKIYPLIDSMHLFKVYNKNYRLDTIYKTEYMLTLDQELSILFSGKIDKKLNRSTSLPESTFKIYLTNKSIITKNLKYLPLYFNTLESLRYKQLNYSIE
jgi:hypothetical protein